MAPVIDRARAGAVATWTMDELLDRLRAALPRLVTGGQPRYKVTDVPDARTVRYYVSLGLVDPPGARRGTFALYGPKHLLQVLAVKKLQAEYLPIRKIETMLAGLDARELERLIGEPLDLLAMQAGPEGPPAASGRLPVAVAQGGRGGASGAAAVRPALASPGARVPAPRWSRFTVHPGVELHVRDGVEPDRAGLEAIQCEIARILERPGGE
jgi:DNA-binding transcriptional MerR regulator